MRNIITARFATNALLIIFSLVIIFHVLVLSGIVPFDMVWGGRLQSKEQMITFELTSIAINIMMLTIVTIHAGVVKVNINKKVLKTALWLMFVLFLFNTLGNLLSVNVMEKIIFTPITILLSVFCLRLAID